MDTTSQFHSSTYCATRWELDIDTALRQSTPGVPGGYMVELKAFGDDLDFGWLMIAGIRRADGQFAIRVGKVYDAAPVNLTFTTGAEIETYLTTNLYMKILLPPAINTVQELRNCVERLTAMIMHGRLAPRPGEWPAKFLVQTTGAEEVD